METDDTVETMETETKVKSVDVDIEIDTESEFEDSFGSKKTVDSLLSLSDDPQKSLQELMGILDDSFINTETIRTIILGILPIITKYSSHAGIQEAALEIFLGFIRVNPENAHLMMSVGFSKLATGTLLMHPDSEAVTTKSVQILNYMCHSGTVQAIEEVYKCGGFDAMVWLMSKRPWNTELANAALQALSYLYQHGKQMNLSYTTDSFSVFHLAFLRAIDTVIVVMQLHEYLASIILNASRFFEVLYRYLKNHMREIIKRGGESGKISIIRSQIMHITNPEIYISTNYVLQTIDDIEKEIKSGV